MILLIELVLYSEPKPFRPRIPVNVLGRGLCIWGIEMQLEMCDIYEKFSTHIKIKALIRETEVYEIVGVYLYVVEIGSLFNFRPSFGPN